MCNLLIIMVSGDEKPLGVLQNELREIYDWDY